MSLVSTYPTAGFATPGLKFVVGSFRPDGSSSVVSGYTKGKGYSVARTGTGTFTITFSQIGYSLVGFFTSLRCDAPSSTAGQWSTGGSYDTTAKTMTLQVFNAAGTLADPPASEADNVISFMAVFQDTSV